jgi:hypothetical protein
MDKYMTSRDFVFWLNGYFEISTPQTIGKNETELIKKHLNLVFKHEIDPAMGDEKHQQDLNIIHNIKHQYPQTEEEAIAKWGNKPSPDYTFNIHGWYNPKEGVPRC